MERELAVRRSFLRLTPKSTLVAPTGGGTETENKGRQISIQSSVQQQHAEVARLRRQQKLELFQTIQRMKSAGMKVSQIARHLGINRRRIDRWVRLDMLPERNRMEPRPGMVEWFRDYLQQRLVAGCRHGRTLLAEIRERGYVGAFSTLAKFLSPWRQAPAKTTTVSTEAAALEETPTALAPRQVSPQVAAALLSKFRTDLTPEQAEIVDAFKQQCPGFAVDAEIGFDLSLSPARGQAVCAAPVDEARAEDWHSCADTLCANFATRPPRRRSSSNGTLEQRTGRRTH